MAGGFPLSHVFLRASYLKGRELHFYFESCRCCLVFARIYAPVWTQGLCRKFAFWFGALGLSWPIAGGSSCRC